MKIAKSYRYNPNRMDAWIDAFATRVNGEIAPPNYGSPNYGCFGEDLHVLDTGAVLEAGPEGNAFWSSLEAWSETVGVPFTEVFDEMPVPSFDWQEWAAGSWVCGERGDFLAHVRSALADPEHGEAFDVVFSDDIDQHQGEHAQTGIRIVELVTITTQTSDYEQDLSTLTGADLVNLWQRLEEIHAARVDLESLDLDPRKQAHAILDDASVDFAELAETIRGAIAKVSDGGVS